MGLHPWHPDVQALSIPQLRLAALLGRPDQGRGFREDLIARREREINDASWALMNWMDEHVTRRP